MPAQGDSQKEKAGELPALQHVTNAHQLLTSLRQRIGEHPELGEAITSLELALSILTVKTGGLL